MGAGEGSSSRKKAGKVSIQNSKIVVQGGDNDNTSSEDEQYDESEEETSEDEERGNDPDWTGGSDDGEIEDVHVEVEIDEDEDEDDDEQDASPNPTPEDLDEESNPESALDNAWNEIADVFDGTKYHLETNKNTGSAPKKSTPRSAKALGKMKALDVNRLTAALKNLEKATYGTVSDIDAQKQRKLDKNKARNQAQVKVAAEYVTDKKDYDDKVKTEAQSLKDKSEFFLQWPAKATARAEILESRKLIKYLEPASVQEEAEAKVETETNRIARQLELKYLDRTVTAQVSARTIKAAGKLADEKGFAGKLKRARETSRVKVAARFVTDMEEYKKLIEDDCRPATVESEEDEENVQKILPAERKRVEIKQALEIIKGLDQDEKLAALEEIDKLALALVKERAAKKKPKPRYLIDRYKTGTGSERVEENRSDPANAASQAEESDRQSDEAPSTRPKAGVSGAEPSGRLATLRPGVRIQRQAGQKRKRPEQPVKSKAGKGISPTTAKSKSAKASALAAVEE